MDRDFFRRGTRFSHTYGQLEQADPLGRGTFDIPAPRRVDQLCTSPVTIQQQGERRWFSERSAVVKPNGQLANTRGPDPDGAFSIATPVPRGVRERKSGGR